MPLEDSERLVKYKRLPMVKAGLEAALAGVWNKGGIRVRFLIWSDMHLKKAPAVYRL
jgi:hypothetical protein